MKKIVFIYFLLLPSFILSQNGQWVWLTGENTANSSGSFGIQGLASPFNSPPALYEPCEWKDLNGNFWLYGGASPGYSARNDLWKYDPITNEWTWMKGSNTINSPGTYGTKGIASVSNNPPSLGWGAVSWVDQNGNLWFFGGFQQPNVYCDLWKYEISTNMWTWVKGPGIPNQIGIYGTLGIPDSNSFPGSRNETAAGWTDTNGDLWMFGGDVSFGQHLNDVWKFNIAANTWTFMKGSTTTNATESYITPGQEDPSNNPSARGVHCRWKDSFGNFWLMGGINGSANQLGDLWKFNPQTNNWTYYNGIASASAASYGTICIEASSNTPGSRYENRAAWIDNNSNLFTFGGFANGMLNDLWMLNINSKNWIWISGDDFFNPLGSWGVKGVPSPLNKPSGRGGSVSWIDNNNNLYLFGGLTNGGNEYNDLWKYIIDTNCILTNTENFNPDNFDNQITIFPNPIYKEFSVHIKNHKYTKLEINIYNVLGEILIKSEQYYSSNNKIVDTKQLSNGVYFISIRIDEKQYIKKIIKADQN